MSGELKYADWIAIDWGTSNLRAWALRDGAVLAEASSDKGMASLNRGEFEPALINLIDPWLGQHKIPLVACGMVGAKQGWIEADYAKVPCPPVGQGAVRPDVADPRIDVAVLPGLAQDDPADVMRGEETQIAGYLAKDPDFDGILCLPGTHTKWVQISAGEVVSFRTFMTGEMFAMLSANSVLRHSVGKGWDASSFETAVTEALSRPEALANRFFTVRAESLLADLSEAKATARLSGLLIGAELAAARPYWLGQRIVLIGEDGLSAHYKDALALQGVVAETVDATDVTLAGLTAAYMRLKDQT